MHRVRIVVVPIVLCGLLLAFCVPASAQGPYCTPTYTTGCTFGDGLTLFQLNTINQLIACDGSPNAWYHDYTAVSTQLQAGTLYTVTVQAGYSSTYVSVWVDLDNNNVFDASELLSNIVCASSGVSYNANFTIPTGTSAGNHRLRFRTEWLSYPGPCTSQSYGNSADFTVNVTGTKTATTTAVTSSANPSVFNQSVTFTATVTPVSGSGTPTGTVQFQADGANLGSAVTLNGGVATVSTSSLTVGTHPITAAYSGDANFDTSNGTLAGGQEVTQPIPTLTAWGVLLMVFLMAAAGFLLLRRA